MTKTDEILSAIRYAPGPIGIAAIYEKVRSVEDIKDLSATLSYLHKNGRVDRVEITTPANRKSFAYTMPARHADQGGADASAAPSIMPADGPAAAAQAAGAEAAAPAQARRKPGPKPKAAPALPIQTNAASLAVAAAPAAPAGVDAAALTKEVFERLRGQLAAGKGGQPVHIHIAHLEIHLGGAA